MKKLLLVDGNSMLFRAYYATLYGRMMMRTKNGIPTNAVYGFISMLNKAIKTINPDLILVAWDTGNPTFRHEYCESYKGTRKSIDQELIVQFPIVREYLDSCGITRYECDGIEADDVIGCIAKQNKDLKVHILSSDKDLLQLIDDTSDVYLMKKGISEMAHMDEKALLDQMGITPKQIIDLKSLMGDSADNIPGVKGVGEKTALKLIQTYSTLEYVYEHIEEQKGKLKEKLVNDKEQAFMSKYLATILVDRKLPIDINECSLPIFDDQSNAFLRKYNMDSLLSTTDKKHMNTVTSKKEKVTSIDESFCTNKTILYFDYDNENCFEATLYGFSLVQDNKCIYITLDDALNDKTFLRCLATNDLLYVFDAKTLYHLAHRYNIKVNIFHFDIMIAAFLINGDVHDYNSFLTCFELESEFSKVDIYGKVGVKQDIDTIKQRDYACLQANNLYSIVDSIEKQIEDYDMHNLLFDIEMPITYILYEMEKEGICTSLNTLKNIEISTTEIIEGLSKKIYMMADQEFNIKSPKQLGVILYDELHLPCGKKRSTSADVLEKLADVHPIIPLILQQRKYQKILSTYASGLQKHIHNDGKIHTLFNQIQTQTGRLSSSEPNLQNISIRDDDGKEIRKAFEASDNHVLLTADYSQIELRVLAHMANEEVMIDAFRNNIDIHTKTAMQIFKVDQEHVDPYMRRSAKTVNFGIVYGQSDFGLSEQLHISKGEAKLFIESYFISYPRIQDFMDSTIDFCEKNGYVKTLFNRRRYIREISDSNYMMREFGKRAAMNAPIQGSAADIIKVAMINIYNKMIEEAVESKIILQIHDELIFDCKVNEVDKMKKIVEEGMANAIKLRVPLLAEASFGKTWFDAK